MHLLLLLFLSSSSATSLKPTCKEIYGKCNVHLRRTKTIVSNVQYSTQDEI